MKPVRWVTLLLLVVAIVACSGEPDSLAFGEDGAESPVPTTTTTVAAASSDRVGQPTRSTTAAASASEARSEDELAHVEFIEDIRSAYRDDLADFTTEEVECIGSEIAALDNPSEFVPAGIVAAYGRYCAPHLAVDSWVELAPTNGGINLRDDALRTCFAEVVVSVAAVSPLDGALWFPRDRLDPPSTERELIDQLLDAQCGLNQAMGVAAGLRPLGAVALTSQLVEYCNAVAAREATPGYGPGADAAATLAWLQREFSDFQSIDPPIDIVSEHSTRLLAVREALFLAIDEGLTHDQIQAHSRYQAYADSDFGVRARERIDEYERVNCNERADPGSWAARIAERYDALATLDLRFDEFSLLAQATCQSTSAGAFIDDAAQIEGIAEQLRGILQADCALLPGAMASDVGTPQKNADYLARVDALLDQQTHDAWDPMLDLLHASLSNPRYDRADFERMAIDLCAEKVSTWQVREDPRFNTTERAAAIVINEHCDNYDPSENVVDDTVGARDLVAVLERLTAPEGLLLLGEGTTDDRVAEALEADAGHVVVGFTELSADFRSAPDELADEMADELEAIGLRVRGISTCDAGVDVVLDGADVGIGPAQLSVHTDGVPLMRLAVGFAGTTVDDVAGAVSACP